MKILFYKKNYIKIKHTYLLSTCHVIKCFLEWLTAYFVKNSSLNSFRSFKNSIENIALKIKPNIWENLLNLFLWSWHFEILVIDSIRCKIFRKKQFNSCSLISIVLNFRKELHWDQLHLLLLVFEYRNELWELQTFLINLLPLQHF